MKNQITHIKDVLSAFTPNEITACLDGQIKSGCNLCIVETDSRVMVDVLTKAHYISDLVEQGYTMKDALRKLGSQMRQLSKHSGTKTPLPYKTVQIPLSLN